MAVCAGSQGGALIQVRMARLAHAAKLWHGLLSNCLKLLGLCCQRFELRAGMSCCQFDSNIAMVLATVYSSTLALYSWAA